MKKQFTNSLREIYLCCIQIFLKIAWNTFITSLVRPYFNYGHISLSIMPSILEFLFLEKNTVTQLRTIKKIPLFGIV